MVKAIGKISNISSFQDWCESKHHLMRRGRYKLDFKRIFLTLGWSVTLDKPPLYLPAHKDKRMDKLVSKYCPNWKISLLCYYEKGGGIKPHRDATGYGKIGYSLSTTDFLFKHDGTPHSCKAGTIYRFETKKIHEVPPLPHPRYTLIWWEPDWKYWNNYWNQMQQLELPLLNL